MTCAETGKLKKKSNIKYVMLSATHSLEFTAENTGYGWIRIQLLGKCDFQQLNCRAAEGKRNKEKKENANPKDFICPQRSTFQTNCNQL